MLIIGACNIQVVSDNTKCKNLEACQNDTVGGCHFGRDMVAAKVSARYYWKAINNDVADWVYYNGTAAIVHCRAISIKISLSLMLVICAPYISLQVKYCEVCQHTKRKFDRPAPLLHPISVSDTWNKVGNDLITFPPSKNGYHYCKILTDYFSKWI